MPPRARLITAFLLLLSVPAAAEKTVVEHGEAARYAKMLAGRKTASGEIHDSDAMTAASRTLPLGSKATVTNKRTGKSVDVRINDRGPFGSRKRIIDLSPAAASKLGMGPRTGTTNVKVEAKPSAQPTAALQKEIEARGTDHAAAPKKKQAHKAPAKKKPKAKPV
jgi:rare lipoprotein A